MTHWLVGNDGLLQIRVKLLLLVHWAQTRRSASMWATWPGAPATLAPRTTATGEFPLPLQCHIWTSSVSNPCWFTHCRDLCNGHLQNCSRCIRGVEVQRGSACAREVTKELTGINCWRRLLAEAIGIDFKTPEEVFGCAPDQAGVPGIAASIACT